MGFFNKKVCDICGEEIGLLGNRKLADGNLCKSCARKLSPWMTDRRESTVEEIRRHLMYRAQNQRVLAGVRPDAAVGADTKVYIDRNARKFFVTNQTNWREANPDVIDFSQVIDVQTEVTEHRTEVYHRDREGNEVSFNPPRYRYSYEFETTILVDSPWFNRIRFELTGTRPERIGSEEYIYYEQQANALRAVLMSAPNTQSAAQDAQQASTIADALARVISEAAGVAVGAAATAAPRPAPRAAAPRAATPPRAVQPDSDRWNCACGAVNDGNFCTNCGATRPEKKRVFRCDKCGWTPDDPANPPRFCPNCGDPFNAADGI